jgi:hypothetical protein
MALTLRKCACAMSSTRCESMCMRDSSAATCRGSNAPSGAFMFTPPTCASGLYGDWVLATFANP